MIRPPAFQFYAADYLADETVQLMSLEEEGTYIRLLAFCWREGSIPAGEELLSRLCKGASTALIRAVKAHFVQCPNDPSRMIHPRLDAERRRQEEWRQKSSEGGKKAQATRSASREGTLITQNTREDANDVPPAATESGEAGCLPLAAGSESCLNDPLKGSSDNGAGTLISAGKGSCLNDSLKGGSTLHTSSSSASSSSSSLQLKDSPSKVDAEWIKKRGPAAQAEAIYEAYPRKVGKPEALKAIRRQLARHPPDFLLGCVRRYAIARAGQDPNFTPHPATWFNQQRFNDDPATWGKQSAKAATNFEQF